MGCPDLAFALVVAALAGRLRDGLGHEAAHVAHGRDVVGTVLVVVHAHGQQRPRCRAPQRPHVGRFLALPQHGRAKHGDVRPMPAGARTAAIFVVGGGDLREDGEQLVQ